MNDKKMLQFRETVQTFIKNFGLLEPATTPCGYNLSPSHVYALQELEISAHTVGSLAGKLGLEHSSVSRLADSLVKKGFVLRKLNEANRRETILSLTPQGERAIETIRLQSLSFYQSILNPLSEDEQNQIFNGFTLFTSAIINRQEAKK